MVKQRRTLQDLFHDMLKDIYYAENKILKMLPKMAKASQSKEVRHAFQKHERETKNQVKRLERVFKLIEASPRSKTCDAINGLASEGDQIMKAYKGTPVLDSGLLAAAQSVEHYEISRYDTLTTWAAKLGLTEAADLLQQTLKEEKTTDAALAKLATSIV